MTTENQRNFAIKLHAELGDLARKLNEAEAVKVTNDLALVGDKIESVLTGDATASVASAVIDALIKARDTAKALSGVIEYRWKKVGDDWYVSGPDLEPGETYEVTSSRGKQNVTIEALIGEFGMPQKQKVPEDVEEGIWKNGDGDLIEVGRTRNGHLVGKLIDPETAKREYLGKRGLVGLTQKLTIEEAKEFGKRTGTCMVCSRELTDPQSISKGIGPICETKGYW